MPAAPLWIRSLSSHPPSRAEAALRLARAALAKAEDDRQRTESSEALRSEFIGLASLLRYISEEIPIQHMGKWMRGGHERRPDVRTMAIDRFSAIISIPERSLDTLALTIWIRREIERCRAVAILEGYSATLPRSSRRRTDEPRTRSAPSDLQISLLRYEVANLRGAHERVDQVLDEIDDLHSIRRRLGQVRAEVSKLSDVKAGLGKLRDVASEQRAMVARITALEQRADDPTHLPNRGEQ